MNEKTISCPTCRAGQVWSDTCRRCKCDLRLLRGLMDEYDALRLRCLKDLRENRISNGLELARQCYAIQPAPEARRLLAVCELLNGNWSAANSLACQIPGG